MPVAGIIALHFAHNARDTSRALWHELRLLLRPERLRKLRGQQAEVRHQLRLLAGEFDRVRPRTHTFAHTGM
jgi:hypothetical protein